MRLSKAFILSGIIFFCSVRQRGIKRFFCQEVGNLPGWPMQLPAISTAPSNEDLETSIKDHSMSGEEMGKRIGLLSLGQHVVLCGVREKKRKENN